MNARRKNSGSGEGKPTSRAAPSSLGSIGTAVNNAIAELVPIIAGTPADAQTRDAWLERLEGAYAICVRAEARRCGGADVG